MEPLLRRRAYGALEADPQVLLEVDGGPLGVDADVFIARLIGFEDEVVDDGIRLRRAEPVYLVPLHRRLSMLEPDPAELAPMRISTYVLQSGYALATVAAENAPADVAVRDDFTVRVLYLRYRRRN